MKTVTVTDMVSDYGWDSRDFFGPEECRHCAGTGVHWPTPHGRALPQWAVLLGNGGRLRFVAVCLPEFFAGRFGNRLPKAWAGTRSSAVVTRFSRYFLASTVRGRSHDDQRRIPRSRSIASPLIISPLCCGSPRWSIRFL